MKERVEATDVENPYTRNRHSMMNENKEVYLIVFDIGNEKYGIPMNMVMEVVPVVRITRIQQAPSWIKGITNIRGNMLPVMDPNIRFGISNKNSASLADQNFLIIINCQSNRFAMVVDNVPDGLKIDHEDLNMSSELISDSSIDQTYIKGVVKTDDRMIVIIDLLKAIVNENITVT